jgi:hypothetical protein
MRRRYLIAAIWAWVLPVAACRAFPTTMMSLEGLANAPVLATCVVEEISRDTPTLMPGQRTIAAHATLRVLRSFPQSALREGELIRLDFEALPEGDPGMNGPSVPPLRRGGIFVLPLKLNSSPTTDSWRLIADHGDGLVMPAIVRSPPFSGEAASRMNYLLREVASPLSSGTRAEAIREASYLARIDSSGFATELMRLLESSVGRDPDRWALIAASLVGSLGVPRPTIAEFYSGTEPERVHVYSGSLITRVLRRLGKTEEAKGRLIHQLLVNSDINSWGGGISLNEFAQDPRLVRELTAMLKESRPGSLGVARDILSAGQMDILKEATALAFRYIESSTNDHGNLQQACWVVRDYGSDAEFSRLVADIKRYQYQDTKHYDELWTAVLWSNNKREVAVLDVLSTDERTYGAGGYRYSEIARGELKRIQTPTSQHF